MQTIALAKLQQRSTAIHPSAAPLYSIFNTLLNPHLEQHYLQYEINIALSKPLMHIKTDKTLFLTHSFPLFNLLKSADTPPKLLMREVLLITIDLNSFKFDLAFYELIGMVSRYHKTVKLEQIFNSLYELLDSVMCKYLFGKNELTVAAFCRLINLPERTYYNYAKAN